VSIDQDINDSTLDEKEYRSTRLVCVKLYEGGLSSAYEILNSIKKLPFKGESPELELNIDLVTKHAETAYRQEYQ